MRMSNINEINRDKEASKFKTKMNPPGFLANYDVRVKRNM